MKKVYLLFSLLAILVFTGASCISLKGSSETSGTGGVFKSIDKAEKWQQKIAVASVKGNVNIANVDVSVLVFDPQDSKTIYLGTANNGLLYTLDGAESWQRVAGLAAGKVNDIVVDSKNKCAIYVAVGNKILKTIDCTRSWQATYVDSRVEGVITTMATDLDNPSVIYAGLATGDLLKSVDSGASWLVATRLDSGLVKVLVDPDDSKIVYAATAKDGVSKSTDGGKTWVDLEAQLKEFKGAKTARNLVFDVSKSGTLLLDSKYGMLKTTDAGETWQPMNLLTPSGDVQIYSLAINPKNGNEIYYGTSSTIYKSVDGGASWVTKKMPTARAASYLLVDPNEGNIVYLGTLTIKK